jgi:5-methyltetrahydropteroyltriglutamate--homocysteine methyltransferase
MVESRDGRDGKRVMREKRVKRSVDRVLTTHVGSLIRPPELLTFLRAKRSHEPYDEAAYAKCLADNVATVVRQQADIGIDVVSDGEFGKSISWSQYVLERLSGFESRPASSGRDPYAYGADRERFKEFYAELDGHDGGARGGDAVCVGPITYTGQQELQRDIDNFKAALAKTKVEEGFLPVAAPSSAIPDRKNEYYKSEEEMLHAIAAAMRVEYKTIVDNGLLVQVDDARAAVTYDRQVPPKTFKEYRNWVAMHMDALNHALEGIPEDRVRYHVCWGSWPGPHVTDVPLKDIVDLILRVRAGAYVIEGANPRHEHEWEVWKNVKMPKDRILIPGVISHATNVVEHPELVAQRLVRYAKVLGRENVIGSTDCGFAQGPFMRRVHPSIMWAKLEALAAGARIASKELFGTGRKPAAKPARGTKAGTITRLKARASAGKSRPATVSRGRRRKAASGRRAR